MQTYRCEDIRNVALIGHGASGKTALSESMLFSAGITDRIGSIDAGNTISDYHPDEQKRKISISATPLFVEWQDKKINIIDTPGYSDFVGEAISSLAVVDMAVLAIHGVAGLEVGTEQTWELAGKYGLPKMVVVNLLDKEHSRFDQIIDQARERLGKKIFPLQIPINSGPGFNQVADVLRCKLLTYQTDGSGKYEESDLVGELKEKVEGLHQELIENVAEADDSLLELFFEKGGLSEDQLQGGLHAAFLSQSIIPCFATSGLNNIGVSRVLDFIARYGMNPGERGAVSAQDDKTSELVEVKVDGSDPVVQIFKTVSEAHVGDLSYFRIYSGGVQVGMELYNPKTRKAERLGQLSVCNGKNRTNVSELWAGDIGTVVKLKNTHTSDTLSLDKHAVVLPVFSYPTPNVNAALIPKTKGDEDKIGLGLSTIREEDPTIVSKYDSEVKQTIISGQGELHLQIATDRLKQRFNVEVDLIEPRIPYRETCRGKGDSKYRHKKQSGGAGQFAEVWLTVEGLPRGSGIEITESLVGQNVDRVFVVSVEKGIKSCCEDGVLAGYRIVDIKTDFYDGKMHPVDSKDIAFQIAGKGAFHEAFLAAKPCLLEPIIDLTVKVPEEYMGDVMGDISSRRGRVSGMDTEGSFQVVKAKVPQANLYTYASNLRSMTGGRGFFTIAFSHYEEMPKDLEAKVIAASKNAQSGEGD